MNNNRVSIAIGVCALFVSIQTQAVDIAYDQVDSIAAAPPLFVIGTVMNPVIDARQLQSHAYLRFHDASAVHVKPKSATEVATAVTRPAEGTAAKIPAEIRAKTNKSVAKKAQADSALILDRRVGSAYLTSDPTQKPVLGVAYGGKKHGTLYFFTELWGMQGRAVVHRWESKGRVISESRIQIGGPRWRAWSRYDMIGSGDEPIKISVYDEKGELLAWQTFPAANTDGATVSMR